MRIGWAGWSGTVLYGKHTSKKEVSCGLDINLVMRSNDNWRLFLFAFYICPYYFHFYFDSGPQSCSIIFCFVSEGEGSLACIGRAPCGGEGAKKIIVDGSMHRIPNLCMFFLNVSLLRSETLLAFSSSTPKPSAEPSSVLSHRGVKSAGVSFFFFYLSLNFFSSGWIWSHYSAAF